MPIATTPVPSRLLVARAQLAPTRAPTLRMLLKDLRQYDGASIQRAGAMTCDPNDPNCIADSAWEALPVSDLAELPYVDDDTFAADVVEATDPVIVDFFGDHCRP